MSLLALLQLAGALFEAAKNAKEIVEDLKAKGHKDNAPIPPEHEQKIRDLLKSIPATDTVWDETHAGE